MPAVSISLLLKQAHQLGLAPDAGLVEDFGQMAARHSLSGYVLRVGIRC
jgi:hypothetical protein